MKNKILISLLFLLSFIILISVNNKVGAFEFNCNGKDYNTEDYNIELCDYYYIYYRSDLNLIGFYTSTKPLTAQPTTSGGYAMCYYGNEKCDIYRYIITIDNNKCECFPCLGVSGNFLEGSFYELIYSNYDIYLYDNSEIFFSKTEEKIDLNLNVSPEADTKNVPVKISTDFYSLKVFEDILVQYSTNQNDWTTCSWGLLNDGSGSANKYNFYLDVYKNGTYYFRLWNAADNTYIYKTVVISNIVYSPDDVNNYVNGVFDPTPFLTYEYINDNKINIITQKFFIDQIIDLQCFYAKDISKEDYNNKEKWTKVEARTMIDQLSQRDVYQFCFEVDNNSFNADGTYTVCFYNVFLDKYTYSDIVINFDEILKVDGSIIWRYVHFFKERFGFLIYPFDLTINTLKRINTIDYSEPKFNVPDIYEPTTNKKLISAVTFNFNDYLENNTFKNVHNIYLIIVDAAIIFGLLNLAWKKIAGVFK